ncbi:hypothetical protein K2173_012969 [Erythroxylum novogranatense]|uniref:Uncharacterized protein n=1 Tax=Erythroxylum novogranatense TaxID=1862640 RepID=A0AAV8S700_9ROSI|nr:hypothetical protein K2173_012969 [Erythroxylum novogranatense]
MPPSPLLPFLVVHEAAESSISTYIRYLQSLNPTIDSKKQFVGLSSLAPLVSPRWNNLGPPPPPQQQQSQQEVSSLQSSGMVQSHTPLELLTSPLQFGCLNSPRSQYPLLSPCMLLSPSSFPLSPTLLVPSPTWRGL